MDIRHENVEYSDLNIPIYCRTVISNEENISANFHIHEEIEIVYVSKGSQTFTFIDESVVVHEGEILVINSMCPHCSDNGLNTRIHIAIPSGACYEQPFRLLVSLPCRAYGQSNLLLYHLQHKR